MHAEAGPHAHLIAHTSFIKLTRRAQAVLAVLNDELGKSDRAPHDPTASKHKRKSCGWPRCYFHAPCQA